MPDNDQNATAVAEQGQDTSAAANQAPAQRPSGVSSEEYGRVLREKVELEQRLDNDRSEQFISQLPEAQRGLAREKIKLQRQAKTLVDYNDQMERNAQVLAASKLGSEHGVDPADLMDAPTPEAMEKLAKALGRAAAITQGNASAAAAQNPSDNERPSLGDDGSGVVTSASGSVDLSKFENTGDVEGALRAMREAGVISYD